MSEATAPPQAQDHPAEAGRYLNPELTRARFIEQGQAYLADLALWARENNHRLRGRQVLGRYAKAHDALIALAYAHVARQWRGAGQPPAAVAAVGGYGRGELFLRSDVDVLLLMERKDSDQVQEFIKSLLHLLIDMRLDLGYSTRTVAECEATIGHDLESATAMTESRPIAGQRALFQKFQEAFGAAMRGRWRGWFLKAIYQQWRERREKFQSTVYLLEPNLKEGAGGLRDVHSVLWTLFALSGSTDLKLLKEHARFEEDVLRRYREAIDAIQTIRNEVHIASGGKNDQLLFVHQPAIARRLGYEADQHRSAEEVFMGEYYRQARVVERASKRAIRTMIHQDKSLLGELVGTLRRRKIDEGLYIQDEVIFIDRAHFGGPEHDPRWIMELFERAARLGCRLSDETLEHIARLSPHLGPAFRLDPANHRLFLRLLGDPRGASRAVKDMHESGVLEKFLPEFERISCMVRIDYYHHFTVDEHSIRTLEMAERLLREPAGKRSFAAKIAHQVKRWDLLNLALLLHDVGKGYGRGHALRGGQIAQRVGDRLKLPPADIELVRFLVLSHLKMSHAAQRRDLDDPHVAQQLAGEIGSLERLKMLYVHSVCDLMAVSPETWTDWKDRLLTECYMRTAEVLGEAHPGARSPAPNLELLREKVLAAALEESGGQPPEGLTPARLDAELEDFLKHALDRYIQASPPATIARHFLMRRRLSESNAVEWRLQQDTGAGFSELTVSAADAPGLFSNICGALAAKEINIWSAQIFSTTDGIALDRFQVTDLENKPLPEGLRLERLRHDLNQVIQGEKPIETLIEKHRGRARRRARGRSPLPSTVLIDNDSSRECTVIEIRTADRPGLLYQITRALSECQLDIQRSIITTEAYGVVDVFYVTDLEYNKIHDANQRKQIEQTILQAIAV